MKRKSGRAKNQKVSPFSGDLELIEPDAAAVEVGRRSHWVAVNPQRDPNREPNQAADAGATT